MLKSIYFSALALCLSLVACQTGATTENTPRTAQAMLHWTGEFAADGCGFEIEIAGKRYIPEDENAIPATYKNTAESAVLLQYELLPKPIDRRCGMVPQPRIMPALQVLSVEAL